MPVISVVYVVKFYRFICKLLMLGNITSHKKLNTNHSLHRSVEHRQRARILRLGVGPIQSPLVVQNLSTNHYQLYFITTVVRMVWSGYYITTHSKTPIFCIVSRVDKR